ncbi:MAG: flagellar biosynthetic protein FliO [Geminicoccaceae bacterium]
MTALMPELPALARSLLALAAVVTLVAVARWLLPRPAGTTAAGEQIEISASLALDPRTRLVIVRRGATELALTVGPQGVVQLDLPPGTRPQGSNSA